MMKTLSQWVENWKNKQLVSLEKMSRIAATLAAGLRGGDIICLSGPFGSGKTTFVQMLGKNLGIDEIISSPSFNLYEKYIIHDKLLLFHFDLYRIREEKEFENLEFEEIWGSSGNISLIEWPEKAYGIIPSPHLLLRFDLPGVESDFLLSLEEKQKSFWHNDTNEMNQGRIFNAGYIDL